MGAVEEYVSWWPASPILAEILGTVDPAEITALLHERDDRIVEIFHFSASVGVVAGISRFDGTRVAMKLHGPAEDAAYLDEVQVLQASLAAAGFPAPAPLGRRDRTTWEEWLDDGEFRDSHDPRVRSAMARELARLHLEARKAAVRPRRVRHRPDGLWPVPHNALFDFEGTTDGAGWIDEIARAAAAVPPAGEEVVGHDDWSAKHLRFADDLTLTAVLDWDSATTELEPTLVGHAAGSFTYTKELGYPIALWPTARESLAFIAEYEHYRGEPFTQTERDAAIAAAVYLRAYGARCQHALTGEGASTGLAAYAAALSGAART